MDGKKWNLTEYLNGDKKFIIPVYQRNYDWKQKNCQKLLEDLIKIQSAQFESYFIGSLVSKRGVHTENYIIDGQQRLTTLSLIFIAIYKIALEQQKIRFADKIYNQYLVNQYSEEENNKKLHPIKRDNKAFLSLFSEDEDDYIKTSNIFINFQYFYDEIKKRELDIENLEFAIKKLIIIWIDLQPEDDEQLIFESLNSTGLDLSNADKIRNFLLMNEKEENQQRYFETYWEKIEENTDNKPSTLIKYYLQHNRRKNISDEAFYENFKDYFNKKVENKEQLLIEIKEWSKAYSKIRNRSFHSEQLNYRLKRLSFLENTTYEPFLIAYISESKELSEIELSQIVAIIETYLVRRYISEVATNALNKVFLTLYSDTMKLMERKSVSFSQALVAVLLMKSGSARFPKDDEFIQSIGTREIYKLKTKSRAVLFEAIQNELTPESPDILEKIIEKSYSIEHIMPQTLNNEWIQMLGDNYKEVHDSMKHRLGNLTVTALNSELSNRKFSDKVQIIQEKGALKINEFILQQSKWTENEILENQKRLSKILLSIFSFPVLEDSSLLILDKITETLVEHEKGQSYTNKKPIGYEFLEGYKEEGNWIDIFIGILTELFEYNPLIFNKFVENSSWFSNKSNDGYTEIKPNLYLVRGISNMNKFSLIDRMLDLYEIQSEKLKIKTRDIEKEI
ncbi:DUF262 domain-containing protein [Lactococcus lactis]|uniref:DUF262 domain-containing protein n=1 Tax=Lactococcus lactis TaxID=1358 RepID=UPI0024167519|nr:DUF262 domain-containing HNH endonuclease family protein [Lactococcus lactis]MDG4960544.1 DUF262 domain-containing HNH endonuclease family protein [Lactococcus lactis]